MSARSATAPMLLLVGTGLRLAGSTDAAIAALVLAVLVGAALQVYGRRSSVRAESRPSAHARTPSYARLEPPRWRETLDPALRDLLRPLHIITGAEDTQQALIRSDAPQHVRLRFVEPTQRRSASAKRDRKPHG
jgi:hypothetical protein